MSRNIRELTSLSRDLYVSNAVYAVTDADRRVPLLRCITTKPDNSAAGSVRLANQRGARKNPITRFESGADAM